MARAKEYKIPRNSFSSPNESYSKHTTGDSNGRILALVFAVLVLGAWFWTRSWASWEGTPSAKLAVPAPGSALLESDRATRLAELKLRQEALERFAQQLKKVEIQNTPQATVPRSTVEDITRKLDSYETLATSSDPGFFELIQARRELRQIWREQASFIRSKTNLRLPSLPPLDQPLIALLGGAPEAKQYLKRYQQLSNVMWCSFCRHSL